MAQAAQVDVSSERALLLVTRDSSAGCVDHCTTL